MLSLIATIWFYAHLNYPPTTRC